MKYDVLIIGGGPAGMMAAGRAGELGVRALLLEKNKALGVKLLATGGGRCNITNKIDDLKELAAKFGKNGKFLFSAFFNFGPDDTINFFKDKGVKIKIENTGRAFPVSDKARDILNALINYLKKYQVGVKTGAEVKEIVKKYDKIEKVVLVDGEEIFADNFIIATGGKSYPTTGATGDGYQWLKESGHTITELAPALVPITVKENFVKELEGLSLKNVKVSVFKDNKKIDTRLGEAIFTSNGLSGPIILDMSKEIGKSLSGKVTLKIDFCPEIDFANLDLKLRRDFQEAGKMAFKNSLNGLLGLRMIPVIANLAEINPTKKLSAITKEERKRVARLLKDFELNVIGLAGYDKAMATSGGVNLREINPGTMKSKIIDNLYFAGEILGIDGPSGGYNLQVSWSTGRCAGESATRKTRRFSDSP